MGQAAELQYRNRLYEQQLDLCKHQAEERENYYLELRRMRHDMKNHLSGILGMVNAGQTKDAREYIQKMLVRFYTLRAQTQQRSIMTPVYG